MKIHSIFKQGNPWRLKHAFQKTQTDDPLRIAFLGGSITSGHGLAEADQFPFLLTNRLKEHYPSANIQMHNFGVPGLPSIFGLYQAITLLPTWKANIIFLEYAANDTKDDAHQTSFESLVSYCLNLPNHPAVVILLASLKNGYSCKGFMGAIGNHYKLPTFYLSDSISEGISAGQIQWDDYASDYGHPNKMGTHLISDLIYNGLESIIDSDNCEPMFFPKQAFLSRSLTELSFLKLSAHNGLRNQRKRSVRAPFFEITLECHYIFLLYLTDDNEKLGTVEFYADGTSITSLCAYRMGSWPHVICKIIKLGDKISNHHIELFMQKGEEQKLFSLLDIGYC